MAVSPKYTASWLAVGGTITAVFGVLGYLSARPDSLGAGLSSAGATGLLTLGAWWLWNRQEARPPAPAAEYLAALWIVAYVVLLAMVARGRSISLADSFLLLPPLSFIPLVARTLLGDDGEPLGLARSVAYLLHRILGWLLTGLAGLFVVSVFFSPAAPLPLVAGLLHFRAAYVYRLARPAPASFGPDRGSLENS